MTAMKDNTRKILIRLIEGFFATIIICTLLICIAYIFSPTDWTFGVMIDDDTVEVFKTIYNCTN